MKKSKPIKHKLLRKHRIVVWEDSKEIGIGKIVDPTIKQRRLNTYLEVGEIVMFERRLTGILTHNITHDISDTKEILIKHMRLPVITDRSIYNLYRHK